MPPNSKSVVRGALWISPTGAALERLQTLTRSLAMRIHGPALKPHVALLQGIEAPAGEAKIMLAELARRLMPFTIKLGAIGCGNAPHSSFYAQAEPLEELWSAHRTACEIFGHKPDDDYAPQLGLVHGELDPRMKEQLRIELGGRLHHSFPAASVHLVNAAADLPVSLWRSLAERPFDGVILRPTSAAAAFGVAPPAVTPPTQ